jgi:DNA polymerase III alpha subunit
MAKIIKIRTEHEDVYDISVPLSHNFVLDSGVCAHNCAHSASYGIVAYNCCYLKYFYPAYFWYGELEANSDDFTKTKKYFKEGRDLVLPLDIRYSDATHWKIEMVNGKEMLRPPLKVVKGVAEGGTEIKNFLMASSFNTWEKGEKRTKVEEVENEDVE